MRSVTRAHREDGAGPPLYCPGTLGDRARARRGGAVSGDPMPGKVLVVDDDASVQRLLQHTLRKEGFEVVIAGDGGEGFRLWQQESFSLVLLDVTLQHLDGYEVAT